MSPSEQRSFKEHVDVTRDRNIQGATEGGLTVRSGATCTVQGAVAGSVTVEEQGVLSVQGAFAPDSIDNRGTLLLAGVLQGELPTTGKTAVAVGTLLTNGATHELLRDGTLAEAGDNVKVEATTAEDYLVYDPSDQSFRPTS